MKHKECEKLQDRILVITDAHDNEVRKMKSQFQSKLEDVRKESDNQTKALNFKIKKLEDEAKESDRVYKEILNQMEEDYDLQLTKAKTAVNKVLQSHEAKTQEMNGSIRILTSKRQQLMHVNEELRTRATFSEGACKKEFDIRQKVQR